MERYKKLFIFILVLVVIYMTITRSDLLPSHYHDLPTKKILKGIIGLIIGIGAIIIYTKKAPGNGTNLQERKQQE